MQVSIGERIRLWRWHRGYTIDELAALAGIYKSALGRMETGVQDPKSEDIAKIVHGLGGGLDIPTFYRRAPSAARPVAKRKAQ